MSLRITIQNSKPMAPRGLATILATSLPPAKGLATDLAQPAKSLATSFTQPAKGLATSLAQPAKGLATSLAPPSKGLANGQATQLPICTPEPAAAPATKMELWKPSYIRSLKPLDNLKVPSPGSMQTFTRDFITSIFGGMEHSPSLFYIPTAIENPLLSQRTYYLMDSTVEPFLPSTPGQHGAKLTPFFNNASPEGDEDVSYNNVPLFIASSAYLGEGKGKSNEYVYYGAYSQNRWSDKLDADRLHDVVSEKVKQYWASTLADPGRPKWMTAALAKHFYPQPEYTGALPEEDAKEVAGKQIQKDITEFLLETAAWKQYAAAEVAGMGKEAMMKQFKKVSFILTLLLFPLRFWVYTY